MKNKQFVCGDYVSQRNVMGKYIERKVCYYCKFHDSRQTITRAEFTSENRIKYTTNSKTHCYKVEQGSVVNTCQFVGFL